MAKKHDFCQLTVVFLYLNADISVVASMMMEMLQIMWKPNKFYRLANIRWHFFKCADQCQSSGVNRAINIGLHQRLIEVKKNLYLNLVQLKENIDFFLNIF